MFNINLDKPLIYEKKNFSESPFGRVNGNEIFHKNISNYSQLITIFATDSSFSIDASNNNGSGWVNVLKYSTYNQERPSTMMQFVLPRGYWLKKSHNTTGYFTGYVEQLNY